MTSKLLLIGSLASLATAQVPKPFAGATVTTPMLGHVATGTAQLRTVAGLRDFPSLSAAAVALPEGAARALLSPAQNYVLVDGVEGGWSVVVLTDGSVHRLKLTGDVTLAAISPSGESAAFYDASANRLQVLTGLPRNPHAGFNSDLHAPITGIAVDDSGQLVLAGAPGSVSLLRAGEPAVTLLRAGNPTSIRFGRKSARAFVADSERNQILSVTVHGSGADTALLASEADGVAGPADVAINEDASRLLIANAGARNLLVLPIAGGAVTAVSCDFEPSRITALRDSRVFAVASADGQSTWMLRLDGGDARMLYVPVMD